MTSLRVQVSHLLVQSGQTVTSSAVGVRAAAKVGIWAPAVNSCEAWPQVSWDVTSAHFVRPSTLTGSADFGWSLGTGSKFLFAEAVQGASHMKVELGAAQTDTRSFAVVQKF